MDIPIQSYSSAEKYRSRLDKAGTAQLLSGLGDASTFLHFAAVVKADAYTRWKRRKDV